MMCRQALPDFFVEKGASAMHSPELNPYDIFYRGQFTKSTPQWNKYWKKTSVEKL
jgi:hypothetical protein